MLKYNFARRSLVGQNESGLYDCLVPVVYNKLSISQMVRINRTPDGATLSKDGVLETGPTV
ncbi:hypothetical protein T05_13115 [Trichinella murrelli]|uniref:Uncharacterized protein n=1 Tax=Trichinella murrelli TaxID=144512 RepID=A0A0V0UJQ4_9BILA|nr:hypothetical protein T05_13115 [Trichinella murrelli]